jgi:adenine-specific DNA-methyltransferase
MARKKTTSTQAVDRKRPIETYEHKDKQRVNNPPVGLVTPETDPESGEKKKSYAYDPHLDPQLQWAGKAEHTSFEVPTVSLHVHERVDPRTIVEAVRRIPDPGAPVQFSLFATPEENPPLREAIEFYKHAHGWSNRFIAGDSLLVMNSLLEKEGMAGTVQMSFIDPPYGIKYGSNFQPFVNKRDVKDGKDEDLTYLRDRLLLDREALTESGSVFVQISDENVHHVRELMDEVFGARNFAQIIPFRKKLMPLGAKLLEGMCDYLLWYVKDMNFVKYRPLFQPSKSKASARWTNVEMPDGNRRKLTREESENLDLLPTGARVYRLVSQRAPSFSEASVYSFTFRGRVFSPPSGGCWVTTKEKMQRLADCNRLEAEGDNLSYVYYHNDFPYSKVNNYWDDTSPVQGKTYVVQTTERVIERCLLMTTDPGDLVMDITCGSGTTAFVAEQWGRRWITCDTSRVALTLAKQRLMTAVFDYYELAHPKEGVGSGFIYKTVPHVTLKSIANNEPPGTETLYDQPQVDRKRNRVSGPFTVEAVPAPVVKSVDQIIDAAPPEADASIARSGETLRQSEWRDELLRAGIRGKAGQHIRFARIEPLPGCRWRRRRDPAQHRGGRPRARSRHSLQSPAHRCLFRPRTRPAGTAPGGARLGRSPHAGAAAQTADLCRVPVRSGSGQGY